MKKFNYNVILFAVCAVLIIGGCCSQKFLSAMKWALIDFVKTKNIEAFINDVDAGSQEISYKGNLLDLYSLYYRYTDTRVVEKPDETVVRMDNGYLAYMHEDISEKDMETMVEVCGQIKEKTDALEIPFVYVMAPNKAYYDGFPESTENNCRYYFDTFVDKLQRKGINTLNLIEKMVEQGISMEEAFFITDHHWKPETGLWASKEIAEKLSKDYGFSYDASLLDLENYDVEVYEDFFLGSQGKKVGRYFTSLGIDDFSVITPKFDSNLTVTDRRGVITGAFHESMLDLKKLEETDKYKQNAYAAYTGGDYELQVTDNHLIEDGAEILIIRNSFACVVSPYLSLVSEKVHVVDVRHWDGVENAETIMDYIEVVKPDYVLVLYNRLGMDMFDFENKREQ